MKVVVGLGNPGREYAGTRHNVGFRVVEELARRAGAAFRRSLRWPLRSAEARLDGGSACLLVEPLTFMNASGDAVAPLLRKRGLGPADLLVVYDDADLPLGRIRVRAGGGAGGHNGVRSVIERVGSADFVRVRVGVGRQEGGDGLVGHVLSGFAPGERAVMAEAEARAAEAVERVLTAGADRAMNEFNQERNPKQESER